MPSPLTDYYEVASEITLTSKTALEADVLDPQSGEPTGEKKEIPEGTKCRLWRTNGEDTVDLTAEDGTAFRVTVETGDGSQKVNGTALEEAFDGTMFGG